MLGRHRQVKFFSQARGSEITRNSFAAVLHHGGTQEAANSQVCRLFILLQDVFHGNDWLGAANWRKRLLGDGLLYEITTQKGWSCILLFQKEREERKSVA